MNTLPDLPSADLAALIASKLCHDIISPVFGIQSGLELLDDMPNDEESMNLVRASLKSAVAKLQFSRLAYGASGSQSASVDLNEAKTVAAGYMEHEKPTLVWEGEGGYVPKNFAKVVLNLIKLATNSISRGGEIRVTIESVTPLKAQVVAKGERVRMQPRAVALLLGEPDGEPMDVQTIHPYYTLFLAREAGLTVGYEKADDRVVFSVA